MSIEQTLERIASALETIASRTGGADVATAEPPKPRGRPHKAASATEDKASASPAKDTTDPVVSTPPLPGKPIGTAVTEVDLRALVMKCIAAKKRTEVVEVLAGYGANGVATLNPRHYDEAKSKIEALLVEPADAAE